MTFALSTIQLGKVHITREKNYTTFLMLIQHVKEYSFVTIVESLWNPIAIWYNLDARNNQSYISSSVLKGMI